MSEAICEKVEAIIMRIEDDRDSWRDACGMLRAERSALADRCAGLARTNEELAGELARARNLAEARFNAIARLADEMESLRRERDDIEARLDRKAEWALALRRHRGRLQEQNDRQARTIDEITAANRELAAAAEAVRTIAIVAAPSPS